MSPGLKWLFIIAGTLFALFVIGTIAAMVVGKVHYDDYREKAAAARDPAAPRVERREPTVEDRLPMPRIRTPEYSNMLAEVGVGWEGNVPGRYPPLDRITPDEARMVLDKCIAEFGEGCIEDVLEAQPSLEPYALSNGWALALERGHPQHVEALIERGANANADAVRIAAARASDPGARRAILELLDDAGAPVDESLLR